MKDKIGKITDKIDYIENDVEPQGCKDDCVSYANQSWVDMQGQTTSVDGSAIIVVCNKYDCREDTSYSPSIWPLW